MHRRDRHTQWGSDDPPTLFHVCSVTYYVREVVWERGYYAPSAPMSHLWNYILAFYLQLYKTTDRYTTTKNQQYFTMGARNLTRCQLHQSRFAVLPSPAAAATHSPAVCMNRQPGLQRPRDELQKPSHNPRWSRGRSRGPSGALWVVRRPPIDSDRRIATSRRHDIQLSSPAACPSSHPTGGSGRSTILK